MSDKNVKIAMRLNMAGFRDAMREAAKKYARENTTYARSEEEEEE